jgi:hypothetical protein
MRKTQSSSRQITSISLTLLRDYVRKFSVFNPAFLRDSSVGIAIDYGAEWPREVGLRSPGKGHVVQGRSGTHPASSPKGEGSSFLWLKRPGA